MRAINWIASCGAGFVTRASLRRLQIGAQVETWPTQADMTHYLFWRWIVDWPGSSRIHFGGQPLHNSS
jgi:hypothetical protein